VLRSNPFGAVNVPLQQLLADRFGVPAIVDHDACFGAGAEAADGAAADVTHFIYFSVNTTTHADDHNALAAYGSALFLQGRIYRGAFYGAGELSAPLEPAPMDLTDAHLAALTDADGAMPAPLIELAERIGRAVAPMINLVDVQMVVLAGTVQIVNRRFIAAVQAAVTERLVAIPGRAVRVVRSAWEPEAPARGAAIGVFDHLIAEGQLFDDRPAAAPRLTSTDSALLA
ncbi:MAG: ROK family protein, partial [Sphingomonas sp.]